MSDKHYVTLPELLLFVALLFILVVGETFIAWKDTRELQQRVGHLEQQCK